LVVGAGLAGIRAALAAKATSSTARVILVSPSSNPHGSSFLNVHNCLGIQVCLNKDEKELFVREAVAIAPPGKIDSALARILAEESRDIFQALLQWGVMVKKDSQGDPVRVKGCFSPVQPRAFILMEMYNFYFKLRKELENQGVEFMPGQVSDILIEDGPGCAKAVGAVLKDELGQKEISFNSKAIVLAIGGSTSAHKIFLSGAGSASLLLHDWCKRNNLEYINSKYTQFVWCKAQDYSDWSILNLACEGACFRDPQGRIKKVSKGLSPFFEMRKTHAPVAYGFDDRAIDSLLINALNREGWVEVFLPGTGWERVVLAAQVSNGGIQINQNGFTGLKGLFACGECAGGMHGANRLGGAMVLAGQVFGKRAGVAAAKSIRY
jgi:L-aspartate oxidase